SSVDRPESWRNQLFTLPSSLRASHLDERRQQRTYRNTDRVRNGLGKNEGLLPPRVRQARLPRRRSCLGETPGGLPSDRAAQGPTPEGTVRTSCAARADRSSVDARHDVCGYAVLCRP